MLIEIIQTARQRKYGEKDGASEIYGTISNGLTYA